MEKIDKIYKEKLDKMEQEKLVEVETITELKEKRMLEENKARKQLDKIHKKKITAADKERLDRLEEAKISIATHALHYGTAAFGGMRAIPNPTNKEEFRLFRTDKHIKRLSQSAKLLLNDISEEYIFKALKEVIKRNVRTPSSLIVVSQSESSAFTLKRSLYLMEIGRFAK